MSSKAGKMEKQVLKAQMPEQKTKSVIVRIDIEVSGDGTQQRSVILEIAGVPRDLPAELEPTVIRTAEQQFSAAINARLYVDTYDLGKSSKDCKPILYNLSRLNYIKILDVKKIDEFNND